MSNSQSRKKRKSFKTWESSKNERILNNSNKILELLQNFFDLVLFNDNEVVASKEDILLHRAWRDELKSGCEGAQTFFSMNSGDNFFKKEKKNWISPCVKETKLEGTREKTVSLHIDNN